ncbi:MAG: alkaline phosphatase family protein, partial [Dysgonamonadaceae bacterium]
MIRIVSSLIAFFSITSLYAQNVSEEPPKLVIGITIDQLRGDYLKMFQQTFGEKGFKRLLNEGLVYSDIKYDFPHPDLASAVTTVYTGTYPFYHGIVGEKKYAKETNQEVSSFFDRKSNGVYTTEQVSPTSIKVSTLTDELKIASVGKSDVYA